MDDDTLRVIIFGSRTFKDYDLMFDILDIIFKNSPPVTIVQGEAKGADIGGKKYAVYKGWTCESYPAEWDKYNRSAGPIRNRQMADLPHVVGAIAFWDGESVGTRGMIALCRERGIKTHVINYKTGKVRVWR